MENRRNERISAHKNVGIEYPGGRTAIGRMRNVSVGGMFVEFETADLPSHALVQLLLPIREGELGIHLRIQAAITRRIHNGIGLLYCGRNDRNSKIIRTWLERFEVKMSPTGFSEGLSG